MGIIDIDSPPLPRAIGGGLRKRRDAPESNVYYENIMMMIIMAANLCVAGKRFTTSSHSEIIVGTLSNDVIGVGGEGSMVNLWWLIEGKGTSLENDFFYIEFYI